MANRSYSVDDVLADRRFKPSPWGQSDIWLLRDTPDGGLILVTDRGYVLEPTEAAVVIARLNLGYSRVDVDALKRENAQRALDEGLYQTFVDQGGRK